jgi:phenylalanyl-tRNA synthetase alpha chain
METEIAGILADVRAGLALATTREQVEEVGRSALGKKGRLTALLRGMSGVPAEERPRVGQLVNAARDAVQGLVDEALAGLEGTVRDAVDVTLPGRGQRVGVAHPLTRALRDIAEIFIGMGFTIVDGPEIEDDWHNFAALSIPAEHPARNECFVFPGGWLLRTETSAMQIRTMEAQPPPVRILCPGRVYRPDDVDATHMHTFHQVEGLMVDEGITMADLKGVLSLYGRRAFGEDIRMRFRPDYFPFVEPGAEVAYTCRECMGAGCALCKRTGWIEVGGAGMVHPNVLSNVGYDPERYTGFAFGLGLERMAMLTHKIDDIRLFLENDARFLRQFA